MKSLINTKWIFKDTLTLNKVVGYNINFTSNGHQYERLTIEQAMNPNFEMKYYQSGDIVDYPYHTTNGWQDDQFKTIIITGGDELKNEELYAFLTDNANQEKIIKNVVLEKDNVDLCPRTKASLLVEDDGKTKWGFLSSGEEVICLLSKEIPSFANVKLENEYYDLDTFKNALAAIWTDIDTILNEDDGKFLVADQTKPSHNGNQHYPIFYKISIKHHPNSIGQFIYKAFITEYSKDSFVNKLYFTRKEDIIYKLANKRYDQTFTFNDLFTVMSPSGGGGESKGGTSYYNPNYISLFGFVPDAQNNTFGVQGYNIDVDWGDGTKENINSGSIITHTYSAPYKPILLSIDTYSNPEARGDLQDLKVNQNVNFVSLGENHITNMANLLKECKFLVAILSLDTTNSKNMTTIFYRCSSLSLLPQLNTSNVIFMNEMFLDCTSLTTIPLLDTSKVTNMFGMFEGCSNLVSIPALDCSKVNNISRAFYRCSNLQEIHMKNINCYLDISACIKMTRGAINEVIDNLVPQSNPQTPSKSLTLGSELKAKLTEQDIKVATDKGWTIG